MPLTIDEIVFRYDRVSATMPHGFFRGLARSAGFETRTAEVSSGIIEFQISGS